MMIGHVLHLVWTQCVVPGRERGGVDSSALVRMSRRLFLQMVVGVGGIGDKQWSTGVCCCFSQ